MNSQLPIDLAWRSCLPSDRSVGDILRFVNQFGLDPPLARIVEVKPGAAGSMPGWQPITRLVGVAENGGGIEIDVRHAWGAEIFKQHLIEPYRDFLATLRLPKSRQNILKKLVIFLCESSTGLQSQAKRVTIPSQCVLRRDCFEVLHFYLRMPIEHPFRLPRHQPSPMFEGFSTTRSSMNLDPVSDEALPSGAIPTSAIRLTGPDNQGGLRTQGIIKKNRQGLPLISIVTPILNGVNYAEQAIQSVINQSYPNVEYVIVDGGSTDGTLNILKEYEGELDYWVSEADRGLYHGMNKGWRLCRGEFVYYLGADDLLLDLPTQELINAQANSTEIVYGDVVLSNGRRFVSRFGPTLRFNNTVHHQGLFLRRSLFESGPFDEALKVFSDFDLNQRLRMSKKTVSNADCLVAFFRLTRRRNPCDSSEFFRIICHNYGLPTMTCAFAYLKIRGLAFRLRGWTN
jgi:hypothetical protein